MHSGIAKHRCGRLVLFAMVLCATINAQIKKETNDLVFIHHSCGENWLNNSLHDALLAKEYVDGRNDITYGTVLSPDKGRPASLGDVPGDNTDMNHWILWFNDYLGKVKLRGSADGYNRMILFKSCFPNSDIASDGKEPGDPFSGEKTLANYKAVYRHPGGTGRTYSYNETTYVPLEDIFSLHPEILFIPITAPPLCYSESNNANAHRARLFNNWLKTDWLTSYNKAHPDLKNVAVFDWFDFLANADNAFIAPNRLKSAYGGTAGDSHPNDTANAASTAFFATAPNNFLDAAWSAYSSASTDVEVFDQSPSPTSAFRLDQNYPNPFNSGTMIQFDLPKAAHVRLSIYNMLGREIAVLADANRDAGSNQVHWDGFDTHHISAPAGVYLVRLEAPDYRGTRRLLLLK